MNEMSRGTGRCEAFHGVAEERWRCAALEEVRPGRIGRIGPKLPLGRRQVIRESVL